MKSAFDPRPIFLKKMKIRTLIVDDEPLARDRVKRILAR